MHQPGSAGCGNTPKTQTTADAGTARRHHTCSGALTLACQGQEHARRDWRHSHRGQAQALYLTMMLGARRCTVVSIESCCARCWVRVNRHLAGTRSDRVKRGPLSLVHVCMLCLSIHIAARHASISEWLVVYSACSVRLITRGRSSVASCACRQQELAQGLALNMR